MGNALKVLWAAPFVSTGHGNFEIVSQGERHHIGITLDRIAQRPEIRHEVEPADGKTGTFVKVEWPNVTRLLREPEPDSYNSTPSAAELVAGFAAFNPHATFVLDGVSIDRTEPEWKKWSPDQPTSAHWYNAETLRDLIAAYIARERDGGPEKTVREFVAEFRGLSSTKKQKTVTEGWSGRRLHDFVVDGDVDQEFIVGLLNRMQAESSPVQPRLLGSVGKDHLTQWMVSQGVTEESIQYQRKQGIDELPFVLELAFGIFDDDDATRQIVTGLNWSSVIGGDPDPYLRNAISEARLDRHDPVMLVVHIARPRFQFADRGKTRLTL